MADDAAAAIFDATSTVAAISNSSTETPVVFDAAILSPHDVPMSIVAILSLACDVLMAYAILKGGASRSRASFYLANWSVCDACVLISVPFNFNMAAGAPEFVYCAVAENSLLFHAGEMAFVGAILLDWYAATFAQYDGCAVCLRGHQRWVVGAAWSVIVISAVYTTRMCASLHYTLLPVCAYLLIYFAQLLTIVTVTLLRLYKLNCTGSILIKDRLPFVLTVSYFICWLPNLAILILGITARWGSPILESLAHFSYVLGYSSGMVLMVVMYRGDVGFRGWFRVVLGLGAGGHESDVQSTVLVMT